MKIKYFLSLFILASLNFLLPTPIHAQNISFSLSPALAESVIKPGKSTNLNLKFNNKGDPAIITFKVLPIEPINNNGQIKIFGTLQSPIHFELMNQDLQLNQQIFFRDSSAKILILKIFVPEDTPVKDYYFSLIAEAEPPPIQEGLGNIRAKITSVSNLLILVTSNGQIDVKPNINFFEVVPSFRLNLFGYRLNLVDSFKKVPVIFVVSNKGTNFIKTSGEIKLKGPLWQIKTFEIPSQNILNQSQRLLTVKSENRPFYFQPQDSYSFELPGSFIGKYSLSAGINFGEGTPYLYAGTGFIVVPFKICLVLFILTIILIFLLIVLKNRPIKIV